jgi:hypothetical protein
VAALRRHHDPDSDDGNAVLLVGSAQYLLDLRLRIAFLGLANETSSRAGSFVRKQTRRFAASQAY